MVAPWIKRRRAAAAAPKAQAPAPKKAAPEAAPKVKAAPKVVPQAAPAAPEAVETPKVSVKKKAPKLGLADWDQAEKDLAPAPKKAARKRSTNKTKKG